MYRYPFAVGEDVYCCWEYDLPERNEDFLKALDAEYFSYVARCHLEHLDSEDRQRAAVGLRATYHHGLETLFSLLGALTQAPHAVPAWIPKCSTQSLRFVVTALARGGALITQRGRMHVNFAALATTVHQFAWREEQPSGATAERFALLWARLAAELLDERNIAEYNSIKHGFRVAAGGFVLRIGEQTEVGVRAPESRMEMVGGSPFGTSFLEPQPVVEESALKFHFRIRHAALNWRAEAMAQRLQLIAWSINNVIGALRCLNGAQPGTIQFLRPEDPAAFDDAWNWNIGVYASNMDAVIDPDDIEAVPRPVLLQELEHPSAESAT